MNAAKYIRDLEEKYSARDYRSYMGGSFDEKNSRGNSVIVTAPYCVNGYNSKGEVIKKAEIFTGGIGEALHNVTGCTFIYAGDCFEFLKYANMIRGMAKLEYAECLLEIRSYNGSEDKSILLGKLSDRQEGYNDSEYLSKLMKYIYDEVSYFIPHDNVCEVFHPNLVESWKDNDSVLLELQMSPEVKDLPMIQVFIPTSYIEDDIILSKVFSALKKFIREVG